MNITSTTMIKTALEQTTHAEYAIDYTVLNGELTRVQATVREKQAAESGDKQALCYINLDHGTINCNYSANEKGSLFLADFEHFLAQIRASLETESE